jgi:hypothetical protein
MGHLQTLLQTLDEEISLEELRIAKAKAAAGSQWYRKRIGEVTDLYNLIERRQLVFLKLTLPDTTFYAQAKFMALELPDGRWIPLMKGQRLPVLELPDGRFIPVPNDRRATPPNAKPVRIQQGRRGDIIEVSPAGDEVHPYEFKTKNAIIVSAGGASGPQDIASDAFKRGAARIELATEGVVLKAGRALNAKVIINCNDPVNGATVTLRVRADKFQVSQVMTYGRIPDRLLRLHGGFIKLTMGAVAKDGGIHLKSTNVSKLPQVAGATLTDATATSVGRPTGAQRGIVKVSEQGPVKIRAGAVKGKPRSAQRGSATLGTMVGLASIGAVFFTPDSLREKLKAVAINVGIDVGVGLIAKRLVGSKMAGVVGGAASFALGLNYAGQSEREELAAKEEAIRQYLEVTAAEINFSAMMLYNTEIAKGNNPEWRFVMETAFEQKFPEIEEERRRLRGTTRDPNKCYPPDRRIPVFVGDIGPSMKPR